MSLYLDASALIPLFIEEASTQRAHELVRGNVLVISDFAIAEFSSGVARRTRNGEITETDAASAFALLDIWIVNAAKRESLLTGDVAVATGLVRRLELGLRAPDAINIAIVQRCEAQLLTFDERLAHCARLVGIIVAG